MMIFGISLVTFVGAIVCLIPFGVMIWYYLNKEKVNIERYPVSIPLFKARMNTEPYNKEQVSKQMIKIEQKFCEYYKVSLIKGYSVVDEINIVWHLGYPFESGLHPYKVYGYYDASSAEVHVGYDKDIPLNHTALSYELVRVLKRGVGHKDWSIPNIGEEKWPEDVWDLIEEMNK